MQTSDPSYFFRTETGLALEDARKLKAERTKNLGSPIDVPGKPLAILVRGGQLWCAESGFVARRLTLESGSTLQVYKGHTGPVTCLDLWEDSRDSDGPILITGSWDTTIKLWNTHNKSLISSTSAHADFVKTVVAVLELSVLISGGADKTVRFWDMSRPRETTPLVSLGFLSGHTRPVQCLAVDVHDRSSATLCTADSMGVIKVWALTREYGDAPRCRGELIGELNAHRTAVNDMWFREGSLWTGSTDDTVLLQSYPPRADSTKGVPPIPHPKAVKAILPLSHTELGEPYLISAAGDLLRVYDVSSPDEPELLNDVDAHWHDVTGLRLWMRKFTDVDGKQKIEPWIISSSLDCTIRKWRLQDLLHPSQEPQLETPIPKTQPAPADKFQLTEEEEKELADLMDSD